MRDSSGDSSKSSRKMKVRRRPHENSSSDYDQSSDQKKSKRDLLFMNLGKSLMEMMAKTSNLTSSPKKSAGRRHSRRSDSIEQPRRKPFTDRERKSSNQRSRSRSKVKNQVAVYNGSYNELETEEYIKRCISNKGKRL